MAGDVDAGRPGRGRAATRATQAQGVTHGVAGGHDLRACCRCGSGGRRRHSSQRARSRQGGDGAGRGAPRAPARDAAPIARSTRRGRGRPGYAALVSRPRAAPRARTSWRSSTTAGPRCSPGCWRSWRWFRVADRPSRASSRGAHSWPASSTSPPPRGWPIWSTPTRRRRPGRPCDSSTGSSDASTAAGASAASGALARIEAEIDFGPEGEEVPDPAARRARAATACRRDGSPSR